MAQGAATSGPRLFRVSRSAADGGAAVPAAQPRRSRGPAPRRRAAAIRSCRPAAAAASRSQAARAASPERSTWGPRRGRRAAALGRRRRGWTHRTTGCSAHDGGVGGAGEGAWRRVGASRRRRNGRVAPYAAARLTGRALGRAGRQNVGNSPFTTVIIFPFETVVQWRGQRLAKRFRC